MTVYKHAVIVNEMSWGWHLFNRVGTRKTEVV